MSVASESVIWHDVEHGSYEADLPLWRELALAAGGPVLDIGCGTGRVALDLGRHGHHVLGVDAEPAFVAALRERAAARDLEVSAEVGDARTLAVAGEFALIIVPMQTIQLLADREERRTALAAMAARLAPRGLIALAIIEGHPGPGADEGLAQPLPDVLELDGWVYSSLPIEVRSDNGSLAISRLRQIVAPDGDLTEDHVETRLALLNSRALEAEAADAGLSPAGRREIAETDLHVGSTAVLLETAP